MEDFWKIYLLAQVIVQMAIHFSFLLVWGLGKTGLIP